jgi:hypothetical protein
MLEGSNELQLQSASDHEGEQPVRYSTPWGYARVLTRLGTFNACVT